MPQELTGGTELPMPWSWSPCRLSTTPNSQMSFSTAGLREGTPRRRPRACRSSKLDTWCWPRHWPPFLTYPRWAFCASARLARRSWALGPFCLCLEELDLNGPHAFYQSLQILGTELDSPWVTRCDLQASPWQVPLQTWRHRSEVGSHEVCFVKFANVR